MSAEPAPASGTDAGASEIFNTLASCYPTETLTRWEHIYTKHVKFNPWNDINATLEELYLEKGNAIEDSDVEAGLVARGWKQDFCDDCEAAAEAAAGGETVDPTEYYTQKSTDAEMKSEDESD